MKKITILIILLISTFSQAQNKFGVFTGVNYSYFTNGIMKDVAAETSFGLQIGVLYEIGLNKTISFRPKLIFSQEGDRTKTEQGYIYEGRQYAYNLESDRLDNKLNYINVPMDFKFWNKIYLIAGPQIGFLISQKPEGVYVGPIKSNMDFGFNLGTGFTVNKFFIEFGLYQGLTTLYTYKSGGSGSSDNLKNGYAKFTLGYNFK